MRAAPPGMTCHDRLDAEEWVVDLGGAAGRASSKRSQARAATPLRDPRVAVIGAGVSGICTAVALRRAGVQDVVVFEKRGSVGGVWRDNTYPGLYCDTPSRYYSYSFAPNPDWERLFAPAPQIQAYLERVAKDFGVIDQIRFGVEVERAEWTPDGRWCVRTTSGEEELFDFVVAATGVLREPSRPPIAGLEDFEGAVFHSAQWDHSVPVDGRRVAVIGNGSTGVQLTRTLAPRCAGFTLFQRTPQWVLPTINPRYRRWSRELLGRWPAANRFWGRASYRFWQVQMEFVAGGWSRPGLTRWLVAAATRAHLHLVRDRALRERLRPTYQPGCKRLILGTGFYQTFTRGQAKLVDVPIDHVDAKGIVTIDGERHDLDVIVLATGFDTHTYLRPLELVGPGGVRLSDAWRRGPRGYRTVAIPGFPNFFLLIGPLSPIGNQAITTIAETQVAYLMTWIEWWRRGRFQSAAPRAEAARAFTEETTAGFAGTVWTSGCDSYYLDGDGTPQVWPFPPRKHRTMLAEPVVSEWELA